MLQSFIRAAYSSLTITTSEELVLLENVSHALLKSYSKYILWVTVYWVLCLCYPNPSNTYTQAVSVHVNQGLPRNTSAITSPRNQKESLFVCLFVF